MQGLPTLIPFPSQSRSIQMPKSASKSGKVVTNAVMQGKYNYMQYSLMLFKYFRKITLFQKIFILLHSEYKMKQIIAVYFHFGAIIPIPFLPDKHYGYESAPSD